MEGIGSGIMESSYGISSLSSLLQVAQFSIPGSKNSDAMYKDPHERFPKINVQLFPPNPKKIAHHGANWLLPVVKEDVTGKSRIDSAAVQATGKKSMLQAEIT